MSEFTKEELKELLYALDCCNRTPVGVKSPPLMLKIQSMIDNYCEHESIDSYVEKERERFTYLATIEEYDRLKQELDKDDARFEFGKICGYFAATCVIDNEIKRLRRVEK